jgi:hypothetical protein
MIGKEAACDSIDAQLEAIAASGRCDRVGASLLLAIFVLGYRGDELAGSEGKALKSIENELKVIALGRQGNAFFSLKTCGKQFTGQVCSHSLRMRPEKLDRWQYRHPRGKVARRRTALCDDALRGCPQIQPTGDWGHGRMEPEWARTGLGEAAEGRFPL